MLRNLVNGLIYWKKAMENLKKFVVPDIQENKEKVKQKYTARKSTSTLKNVEQISRNEKKQEEIKTIYKTKADHMSVDSFKEIPNSMSTEEIKQDSKDKATKDISFNEVEEEYLKQYGKRLADSSGSGGDIETDNLSISSYETTSSGQKKKKTKAQKLQEKKDYDKKRYEEIKRTPELKEKRWSQIYTNKNKYRANENYKKKEQGQNTIRRRQTRQSKKFKNSFEIHRKVRANIEDELYHESSDNLQILGFRYREKSNSSCSASCFFP